MSETSQGPGWWQASDGRWYPPEAVPGDQPPTYPTTPAGYAPSQPSQPGYGYGQPSGYGQQPGYGYGQPSGYGYGQPPGAILAPPPARNSSKATVALVLAIVSFFVCPGVLAIVALVVAASAAKEIRDSPVPLGGESMVKAARIVAIANIVYAVVVTIVVIAVAIPAFFGARDRVWDRISQDEVRNGYSAERNVYRTDAAWTADPARLHELEPGVAFSAGDTPTTERVVYVTVNGPVLGLSEKSRSGTCWYLRSIIGGRVEYAEDTSCGSFDAQAFTTTPWRTFGTTTTGN